MLICSSWEISVVPVSQPGTPGLDKRGCPFVPGLSATCLAHPFVSVGVTNRDKMSSFVPVARPGTKGHPLLSRTGVPGWETGTTAVSQPGQINIFVVVVPTWTEKGTTDELLSDRQSSIAILWLLQ